MTPLTAAKIAELTKATKANLKRPDAAAVAWIHDQIRTAPDWAFFGDRKVFLGAILDLGVWGVKDALQDLMRQDLIILARADLVGAMDPVLVERSQLVVRDASWHFVVAPPPLRRDRW